MQVEEVLKYPPPTQASAYQNKKMFVSTYKTNIWKYRKIWVIIECRQKRVWNLKMFYANWRVRVKFWRKIVRIFCGALLYISKLTLTDYDDFDSFFLEWNFYVKVELFLFESELLSGSFCVYFGITFYLWLRISKS